MIKLILMIDFVLNNKEFLMVAFTGIIAFTGVATLCKSYKKQKIHWNIMNNKTGNIGDGNVISYNQSGGITAHTVNQAVKPEIQITDYKNNDNGNSFTSTATLNIISDITPSKITVQITASNLLDVQIMPTSNGRSAVGMQKTNVQKNNKMYQATIPTPEKSYQIVVTTKEQTQINFGHEF